MRIVLAPNSFKGSASAIQVANWLAHGINKKDPSIEVVQAPIADGGDGSLEVLESAGFAAKSITATDALGAKIEARIGIRDDSAFIESALIIGLQPLNGKKLEPLRASSFGLGEAINQAIELGCRKIILGLGGSATTDGGAGALAAMGVRFLDSSGKELALGGGSLIDLAKIETDQLLKRIKDIEFVAVSDVTNPLLGDAGSAKVFAPQKGASADEVALLEAGLTNLVTITKSNNAIANGAGAAGGLGFMALEFLGATLVDGTTWILQETDFTRKIAGADLIITGEGRYDAQSASTKAPANVARLAKERGVPVALVCGEIILAPNGFAASYQLKDQGGIDEVIRNPQVFLEALGERIAQESADFITK